MKCDVIAAGIVNAAKGVSCTAASRQQCLKVCTACLISLLNDEHCRLPPACCVDTTCGPIVCKYREEAHSLFPTYICASRWACQCL